MKKWDKKVYVFSYSTSFGKLRNLLVDVAYLPLTLNQKNSSFIKTWFECLRFLKFQTSSPYKWNIGVLRSDIFSCVIPKTYIWLLQANLLQDKAKLYSFDCFILKSSTTDDLVQETSLAWGDNEGSFMYIISDYKKEPFLSLNNTNWVTVILREFYILLLSFKIRADWQMQIKINTCMITLRTLLFFCLSILKFLK